MSLTITIDTPRPGMWNSIMQKVSRTARAKADQDMRQESALLKSDIQGGWPVDTGASRAAWSGPLRVAEGHYRLINSMSYAATIEYGGYPVVGPKTAQVGAHTLPGGISVGGGIYPTQKPVAPVRQAMSRRKLAWAQGKFGAK